nr:retrovirus-related Pol polyprotein from transposon TNT 1-94 [Tanacetum cinerariifolium]
MAKASPTQAWLWHRRLSHLNFDYMNLLSKKDIMIGLPMLQYVKDQLSLKHPLFFWAEAIATACYTQNRSIIIPTHRKTPYHIINDRKPSIKPDTSLCGVSKAWSLSRKVRMCRDESRYMG